MKMDAPTREDGGKFGLQAPKKAYEVHLRCA